MWKQMRGKPTRGTKVIDPQLSQTAGQLGTVFGQAEAGRERKCFVAGDRDAPQGIDMKQGCRQGPPKGVLWDVQGYVSGSLLLILIGNRNEK